MTLTGEAFVSPLTKCTPQWCALRPEKVDVMPRCFDKECWLSSAVRTHVSLKMYAATPESAPASHARAVENALSCRNIDAAVEDLRL
jgi:hypothetical protein